MSETAVLSHYVLPARSGYEKWDGTFFQWNYRITTSICAVPSSSQMESRWRRLTSTLNWLKDWDDPGLPIQASRARQGPATIRRCAYGIHECSFRSRAMAALHFGEDPWEELGSKNLALLWGLLARFPMMHPEEVTRAGYQIGP